MATLADSFLDDLDALDEMGEEEEPEETPETAENAGAAQAPPAATGLASAASLRANADYADTLAQVRSALERPPQMTPGDLANDPEYQLMVKANELLVAVDADKVHVHRFLADVYGRKFPELEQLVPNVLDYARVVQRIGTEQDVSRVTLSDILPATTVMVVTLGSTTSQTELSADEMAQVNAACEELLRLEEERGLLLMFVEARMSFVAPNVSAICGTTVAAQLVALAGGLLQLSNVPGDNISVMGKTTTALAGFSSAAARRHMGVIADCELVQAAPAALRRKACKMVGNKVALAARMDATAQGAGNDYGTRQREQIAKAVERWEAPHDISTSKALPVPGDPAKKRRGGRRARARKARTGMTNVRRDANRMAFGSTEDEYGDSAMGNTFGMLGTAAAGQLRVGKSTKQPKISTKRTREVAAQNAALAAAAAGGGAGAATAGTASTIAFTPVQGIELVAPTPSAGTESGGPKYFAKGGGFIKRPKLGD